MQAKTADDIKQETLIHIHQCIVVKKPIDKIIPYCFKVFDNKTRGNHTQYYRRSELLQEYQLNSRQENQKDIEFDFEFIAMKDQMVKIKKVIQSLSPKYRDILYSIYIKDLCYKEIQEKSGTKLSNLQVQHHRAIKKLKTELKKRKMI